MNKPTYEDLQAWERELTSKSTAPDLNWYELYFAQEHLDSLGPTKVQELEEYCAKRGRKVVPIKPMRRWK